MKRPAEDQLNARAEPATRGKPLKRAEPRGQTAKWLRQELQAQRAELEARSEQLRATRAELQRVRERYYELYDLAPAGYVTLDRAGKIEETNRAATELLGVDHHDVAGRNFASFLNEQSADSFERYLQRVFSSNSSQGWETTLHAEAGRSVSVHLDSVSVLDTDGNATACRMAITDLSDLRRAEDGRCAAEAQSRTLVDTATDAIVSTDASGNIESFNRAAQRLFGYAEGEVLGRDISLLVLALFRDENDRYVSNGHGQAASESNREVTGLRKDGTTFPCELGVGEWHERGQRKLTAIIHDVTERKQAEREIRDREARFRQIAEHIEDAIIVRERGEQRVSYASPAFEIIWGRPIADVIAPGIPWLQWVHPDDRSRIELAHAIFNKADPLDEECRICRPDGEIRWVRCRVFPVEQEDGTVLRDVGVFQDVTNERELEEELRQAHKMEAVGSLASGVAHDFNNVLQAVLGCINVAIAPDTSPVRAREFLDRAASAARRGGDLAGQLMTFARKEESAPKPIGIDGVIQGLAKLLQRLVTEQVSVEIDTQAPDKAILGDRVQLEQILMNLAANARDAMPEGGVLSIRTEATIPTRSLARRHRLDRSMEYVRLVVEDSGTGMDERTRERIFEPFFTTKDVGKGTGLGLSTVFAAAKQLGGTVDVESTEGRGTTFSFYFPCCTRSISPPSTRPHPLARFDATALLVEDEPLIRMTVRHYLEQLGLEVLEARGADEAQQLCARHAGEVDVLISDVVLPVMRGPRLAALLRDQRPGLRVLFITANPEVLARADSEGSQTPVLRKPFGAEELAEKLSGLLNVAGTTAETPSPLRVPQSRVPSPESRRDETQKTLLLVEDEPVSRLALTELLESQGYRVLVASQPQQALQIAADYPARIDLLLTDMRLPKMAGDELAKRLLCTQPNIRVVFMSGLQEAPHGRSAFLQKPIDLQELTKALENTLRRGCPDEDDGVAEAAPPPID